MLSRGVGIVTLIHELPLIAAGATPDAPAITFSAQTLTYEALAVSIDQAAAGFLQLGLLRSERVAIYLEKRFETVIATFAAARAGAVFVPINPVLKSEQVGHILIDCNVRVLVTSAERLEALVAILPRCADLRWIVVTGEAQAHAPPAAVGHFLVRP